MKKGARPVGYNYYGNSWNGSYEHAPAIKYRFPAPGSCSLAEEDHHNLYKDDWKTPYRHSEYFIQKIEMWPADDDPEQAEVHINRFPNFPEGHRLHGKDPDMVDYVTPQSLEEIAPAVGSDEMKAELWAHFENNADEMQQLAIDFGSATAKVDYDEDYNPRQMTYHNRGFSGFENNTSAKETFVELEYWIEDVIGKKRQDDMAVRTYKGTPKKWQVLDDDMAGLDREQVEKMQNAIDAPMPEQLEQWQEKHDRPLKAPFNNANITAWRDDPKAIESADFDPVLLGQDREFKRRMFLERFEKPKQLEAETKE
jgi:hypothetical protein